MAAEPPPVRITDLAEPEFPDELRAGMAAISDLGAAVRFDLDRFVAQARAETGLDDFAGDGWVEPLTVLCGSLESEAGLSATGRLSSSGMIVRALKNRLLVEDYVTKHPDCLDAPVRAPIVIAGLPRTGTTHLHNLMSADSRLRSLPWWESVEPVPPLAEQGQTFSRDPRLDRAEEGLAGLNGSLPYFRRMHDMWVDHVHEEIDLLAIGGSTMSFDTLAPMPTWRAWYQRTDQTPYYRYLVRVLQVLQHQRGPHRWVLKSPQHLEQFGPLMTVFPDAFVVVTHRDPVSVTASFATMAAYTARMARDPVDPVAIGRFWAQVIEDYMRACVRDRELLPPAQSIDVLFDEFMADDVAMVARIYEKAGLALTSAARAAMDAFMAEHPRGKHGRVTYDIADFGLDAAERREALRFYTDRFQVRLEE